MADFSKFKVGSTSYNVKDAAAGKSLSLNGSDLSLKNAAGTAISTVTLPGGGKAYGKAHFEADSDHSGYYKIVWDDAPNATVPSGGGNGILYILKGRSTNNAELQGYWHEECNSATPMTIGFSGLNGKLNVKALNTGPSYLLYVYRVAMSYNIILLNPYDNVLGSASAGMYGSNIISIRDALLGVPIYSDTTTTAFTYKDSNDDSITDSDHMIVFYHNGWYAYISMGLAKAPNTITRSLTNKLQVFTRYNAFISDPEYILMPMENESYRKLYTLTKTAANKFTVDNVSNWTNYNWITVGRYSFV